MHSEGKRKLVEPGVVFEILSWVRFDLECEHVSVDIQKPAVTEVKTISSSKILHAITSETGSNNISIL